MTPLRLRWLAFAFVLSAAALPWQARGAEISDPQLLAQMEALSAQRQAVKVEHDELDSACYRRFAVNSCRADVARARRAAITVIKKQELAIAEQQLFLIAQEQDRADQLRRETAAQQELERQQRLVERAQREAQRLERGQARDDEELQRQARQRERAQREEERAQRLQDRAALEQEALERAAAQVEKARAMQDKQTEHAAVAANAGGAAGEEEKARALEEKRAAHAAVAASAPGAAALDAKQRALEEKRAAHAAVAASADTASGPQDRARALDEKRAAHAAGMGVMPRRAASKPAAPSQEPGAADLPGKESAFARKQKELAERLAERERRLREAQGSQAAPLPVSP